MGFHNLSNLIWSPEFIPVETLVKTLVNISQSPALTVKRTPKDQGAILPQLQERYIPITSARG